MKFIRKVKKLFGRTVGNEIYFIGFTCIFNDKIKLAIGTYNALENADALIILTEWNEFRKPDFSRVKALLKKPVIFDGRNLYDPEKMQELHFTYYSIGRNIING